MVCSMTAPLLCLNALQRHARAFQRGDIDGATEMFALPVTIHVMDQAMRLDSKDSLAHMLETYRGNLDVEGYARSEVKLLHRDNSRADLCQALVRWTNYNCRAGRINVMDVSLMFRPTPAGAWAAALIEIVCDKGRNLANGLPLAARP